MADRKQTPDILGSLLGGSDQDTIKPESHNTIMPEKQPTRKLSKKKPVSAPVAPAKEEAPGDKVKATYYLATDLVESLEDGWIQLRKLTPKGIRSQVSKSLIVELAVQAALEELRTKGSQSFLAKKTRKE